MDFFKRIIKRVIFCLIVSFIVISIKHYVFGNYTEDNPFYFYYNGETYPIYSLNNEECNDFVIVVRNNGGLQYIYSSDEFYIDYYNGGAKVIPTNNAYITKVNINNGSYVINNSTNTINIVQANGITGQVLYTNFTIYNADGSIYASPTPIITTSAVSIENWSFDNLEIDISGFTFNENDILVFNYNGIDYSLFLKDYIENVGLGGIRNPISIPKQALNNYIVFTENADISFEYAHSIGLGGIQSFDMGTYSITLSTTTVNELNNNADRNIQNAILDGTQQTNEKLDDLNNSINDDNIDDYSSDLPSTNVNNPTENGIDNIFQSFYNAFCTGTAQDIVFPIPFTNKNITLSPYYVRDMLNNNNASWVYIFIQAFWGYLIGRYIVKDISRKIDKIKGGNIENIENENIKEEML